MFLKNSVQNHRNEELNEAKITLISHNPSHGAGESG
jgi:hypothetical protein